MKWEANSAWSRLSTRVSGIVHWLNDYDKRHRALKFLVGGALLLIYTLGFGERPLWEYWEIRSRESFLRDEIASYEPRLRSDSLRLNQIKHMGRQVEHVAREQYLMKAPGEDIYIVEQSKSE